MSKPPKKERIGVLVSKMATTKNFPAFEVNLESGNAPNLYPYGYTLWSSANIPEEKIKQAIEQVLNKDFANFDIPRQRL